MATYNLTCTDGFVGTEALPTVLHGYPRMEDKAVLSDGWQWVSPTGFSDPESDWTNEGNAYDGNTGTYTNSPGGGSPYLELILPETLFCRVVRIYAANWLGPSYYYDPIVEIYLYFVDENEWQLIFNGVIPNRTWVEKGFLSSPGGRRVSKVRIQFSGLGAPVGGKIAFLYEFEFFALVSPKTQLSAVNTITDGLALTEALLISWKYLLTATDGLELSDAVLTQLGAVMSATDGIKVSDLPTIIKILNLLATDGLVHSDSTLADVAGRLLKILTYALAHRDQKVYARPYYNQKVYTADVSEVEE